MKATVLDKQYAAEKLRRSRLWQGGSISLIVIDSGLSMDAIPAQCEAGR